jgi:hypothetical protein
MTPDRDSSLQLAERLTSKRLPRMASFLVVTAGLTTATLLILAAGNTKTDPLTTALGDQAGLSEGSGEDRATLTPTGSTYGAAVSALRGTIDLAVNRMARSAQLN